MLRVFKGSFCFFALLLLFLSATAAATTDLCKSLRGLARRPISASVDGFSNDFFAEVSSWIATPNCDPSQNSVDWTSDWVDSNDVVFSSNGAVGKGAKVQYHVKGNSDDKTFSVEAKVTVQMTLSKGDKSNPAEATFGFDIRNIPNDLAGRFVPVWEGSLKTTGSNGLGVFDDDLFDGAPAVVVDECSGATPSDEQMKEMQTIVKFAADVNQRFRNFESIPTALSGDLTARLAFPVTSIMTPLTAADVHINGTSGFIANVHGQCRGADCGEDASRTLLQLAGADTVCQTPTLLADTMFGTLSATVSTVAETEAYIHGVRSTIQAVYSCSQGFIGISLDTIADPNAAVENKFSLVLFNRDARAAISQVKAIPMVVRGRRFGYVTRDGETIMTPVSTDMFAHGRGGAFVDDVVITDSVSDQFQAAVSNIVTILNTKYGVVNTVIQNMFSSASSADVVKSYFAQVSHPTSYGLWSYWAEQFNGFAIGRDQADNKLILEINSRIHSEFAFVADDPSVATMNSVMAAVNTKVQNACGTPCNDLTTAPTLNAQAITASSVGIALSAMISIPTMSLSSNKALRSEATRQIKVIRREGAVEGAEDIHMEFIASVTASVASQGSTLDEVQMMYSSVFDKATMIKGTLVSAVTGVNGPVSMGINGEAFFNTELDENALTTFASSFSSAALSVAEKEGMTLDSLLRLNDHANSKIISEVFFDLARGVPRTGSMTVMNYFDSIRSSLETELKEAGVIPFLSLDFDADSKTITLDLTFVSIKAISFEVSGVSWAKNVPVSRTQLNMELSTRVSFSVNTASSINNFQIIGYSKVQDFSLPIRSGMRVGLATAGYAETVVKIPEYSYVIVQFSGAMERGSTFNGVFVGNMSIADPDTPVEDLFSFSLQEDNRGDYAQEADPAATLAAFGDHFMFPSYIAQHQLADAVSPLKDALAEIISFESSWQEKSAWIYSTEAFPTVFVSDVQIPFQGCSETVNITVNEAFNYDNCVFDIPAANTMDDVVASVTAAVSQCGDLATFVNVDSSDSSIVMTPKFAGSLYNFVVDAPEESESFMRSQSWSASRVTPDHLSWVDLYNGIYFALLKDAGGYVYSEPEIVNINVENAKLVDYSRAKFYPTEIPAVFFPASYKLHNDPKKVEIDPDFETENSTVSLHVAATNAVVEGDVNVNMVFGMSLWCSLGDGSLPFSTAFTSDEGNRYDQVVVPAAPDNTFTFVASCEKRSASNVNAVPSVQTLTQTITLTPGKLLRDALLQELPAQLTGLSANMITVEDRNDETFTDSNQVEIKFVTYQPDDDTLYVPLEFTVNPTKLVAFGSPDSFSRIKAMTSCPLTKDYSLDISLDSSASFDNDPFTFGLGDTVDCSGTVGMAGVGNCGSQLLLNHKYSVSSSNSISLLGDMHNVIADTERFSDFYNNEATVSSVLSVNNIDFDVASNTMSSINSETVSLKKTASVPFNQLKDRLTSPFAAEISDETATGRALKSLATTNKQTFCDALEMSLDKLVRYVAAESMNQNVPFTDMQLAPIYSTLINEKIESVMKSICDVTNDRINTLSEFCNELETKFGFDICGDASLSDDGLDFPLHVNPGMVYAPVAFQFDTERFTKSDLSTGFGNAGDLLLETNISASLGMNVMFRQRSNTDDEVEYYAQPGLDSSRTSFSSKAALDSAPTVRTSLGSTVVTFDANNLNVNFAVVGTMPTNGDDVVVELGGSAAFDAQTQNDESSYTCHVKAQVPVMQHYYHIPENAAEDTVFFSDSCLQGNFVSSVGGSFDGMTIAKFIEQDPSLFFKQFSSDLGKNLFNYILNTLTDKAVAFLGKEIQAVCSKALDKITGPDVAASIGNDLTKVVSDIIKKGHYSPADLENAVLKAISGALNKVFGKYLKQPINTPTAPSDEYVWKFRFGSSETKSLKAIDWSCGKHGYADFEFTASSPHLDLGWTASFDVAWSKSKGIYIKWSVDPAFQGTFKLNPNTQVSMSGSLLFLTAEMSGTAAASGSLKANPGQKNIAFTVSASLETTGKLGLVSKLRQQTKGDKANALGALPYVNSGISASWQFNWGTSNQKPTMPTSFKIKEPQLCLGSLIAEFMQQVSREVNRIIKPLDPVFGPDGILLKPIPGLSKILGKHCNVLALLEWTCMMFSDSCNIKSVRTLVNVITDISNDIAKIKQFMTLFSDPQGCYDFGYIYKTFKIDFTKDKPTPQDPNSKANGDIPMTPQENFNPKIPNNQRTALRSLMSKWSGKSVRVIPYDCVNCTESDAIVVGGGNKFGFHLDILQDFPVKLIALLLGGNVPLFSVSFPSASMSYSITWTIPVWSTPYVAVNIHASATVKFQPPSVALMSDGIVDTVKTKNPSHLFRNLAVSTTQPFATGTFEVDGGAEGGINVVIAKVTVNFDITVKFIIEARVANFGTGEWITFDSILMQVHQSGLVGAMKFTLKLRGGFKLYLRACAKVIVFHKCKNLCSWSWDTQLWAWEPKSKTMNTVASGSGQIDTDSVNFNYPANEPKKLYLDGMYDAPSNGLPSYIITNSAIMLMPANIAQGAASLTRPMPSKYGISWTSKSTLCSREYNVIVDGDMTRPSIAMPNCNKAHVTIKQKSYRTVSQFNLKKDSFVPLSRSAIKFSSMASLTISDPLYATQYLISGSPSCPVSLATDYNSVINFTGSAGDYKGKITVTGDVSKIFWAVPCNNLNIGSKSITCSSFSVAIPQGVNVVKVVASQPKRFSVGDDEAFNITIDEIPESRAVEIIGANPLVTLSVSDMKSLVGSMSIVANSNDDNFMHIDMDTPFDRDVIATAYPTHFAYDDSDDDDTHALRHANVNIRSYTIRAAAGRQSTMRLVPIDGYEEVTIDMIGAPNAVIRSEVDGCDRGSSVSVSMTQEGTHTLVLGSNGKLGDVQCDVKVLSDESSRNEMTGIREIVVNASLDARELIYEFKNDHFVVADSANTNDFFRVYTDSLDHVTVHFSGKSASQLVFNKNIQDGTEYAFLFPEGSDVAGFSSVKIPETHSPVILNGPVLNVILGDIDGSVTPLSKIAAVVVAPTGSNIIMNSQNAAEPINLAIQEGCVFEQSGAAVPRPSDWFISAVADLGISYKEGCNVLVPKVKNGAESFSTTFDIVTGNGADIIEASNPAVNVVADMGDGDDTVKWLSPESDSRLFLQMGSGADTLIVQSKGTVNVDLGEDECVDHVSIVCTGDVSPSIVHTSVFPIGVQSSARMEISHWDSFDTLEVSRVDPVSPKFRETAVLAPDVEKASISYMLTGNTDYSVKKCLAGTSFAFTSGGLFNNATDYNIELALDSYDVDCHVTVNSTEKTNGSVLLGVGPNALSVPSTMELVDHSVVFGNLDFNLYEIDQFGVDIPKEFTDSGNLKISGKIAKSEVFVNLPSWSTTVDSGVRDLAIVCVNGKVNIADVSGEKGTMLIALGTADKPSDVETSINSMKEMTMTSGCIESSQTRVLSNWIVSRMKKAGFDINSEQKCSALFHGTRHLTLNSNALETVRASGLGWKTVRSLNLPATVKDVFVESVRTETEDSLWTGAAVSGNKLVVSKMKEDAFEVNLLSNEATISVGSAVFAPSASITVECPDKDSHHVWNLALPDRVSAHHDRSFFSEMNFTSNGNTCSGHINSNVFASSETAPLVRLGKGLGGSILIETTSPEDATIVTRYVNLTNSDGMNELCLHSFNQERAEAQFVWDAAFTSDMTVHLGDRSENLVTLNDEVTKNHPIYLSASVHTAMSFPTIGSSTISFEGVEAAHYNFVTRSVDLLGGIKSSNIFCFNPCEMCSAETWNEIRTHDRPCSLPTAEASSTCAAGAHVHISQEDVPALLSVSCSQAYWDNSEKTEGQCAISFNANGAEESVTDVIPPASKTIAGIVTIASACATVLSASVLLSRILVAIGKASVPEANRWWISNIMRDFYNDQFSWASVVLTACVSGISNFDFSNWNGPVDGLLLEVNHIVFGWLNLCDTVVSPSVIIAWSLAVLCVALRVVTFIGSSRDTASWRRALKVMDPVHAVVSSISLIMLPLTGYTAGVVLNLNVAVGVVTLIAGVCILASIPVPKFAPLTIVRNIASYIAMAVPFVMSIVAGAGASRYVILGMLFVSAFVLPLCNTFVLWKAYFTGGDSRTKQWKSTLFSTFGLRAASLICGLVFLCMLFFNLSYAASAVAYTFWFLWTFLPVMQLIPLIMNTKYSNIVPRWDSKSAYRSLNGETTPLRAGPVNSSVGDSKDMSDVVAF